MHQQQEILACVPHDEMARERIAKTTGRPCVVTLDSALGRCARCDAAVWVGPQQRKYLLEAQLHRGGAATLCLDCVGDVTALCGAAYRRAGE